MKKGLWMTLLVLGFVLLFLLPVGGEAFAHRKDYHRYRTFVTPRTGFFFGFRFYPPVTPSYRSYYSSYYHPYYDRLSVRPKYWVPGHWELRVQSPGVYTRVWVPGYWFYR